MYKFYNSFKCNPRIPVLQLFYPLKQTPGLRALQQKAELENLISKVIEARNQLQVARLPPLLLKVAPDLSEGEKTDIANVILKPKVFVQMMKIHFHVK